MKKKKKNLINRLSNTSIQFFQKNKQLRDCRKILLLIKKNRVRDYQKLPKITRITRDYH